ncbi:hypothetical protein [Candidatus Pantoea formicae]
MSKMPVRQRWDKMWRPQQVNHRHVSARDFSDDQLASSLMSCFAEYRSFT